MGGRKSSTARPCTICGEPMRRNGTTSSGRQRWRCMRCRASSAGDGGNARASAEFRAFPVRVSGRMTLAQAAAMLGVSPRTFIRRIQWCWHARPEIPRPVSPCHAVEADGTYVPYGWCLLVAVDAADVHPSNSNGATPEAARHTPGCSPGRPPRARSPPTGAPDAPRPPPTRGKTQESNGASCTCRATRARTSPAGHAPTRARTCPGSPGNP